MKNTDKIFIAVAILWAVFVIISLIQQTKEHKTKMLLLKIPDFPEPVETPKKKWPWQK